MLTEVTFCITCYLAVLTLEYVPLVLRNRKLRRTPALVTFEWRMHHIVPALALVGTVLSFFHQGSLGGLYGVLRGRPFAFREGFAIWPSTFFLFVISAAAVGPCFVMLVSWCASKLSGKTLVRPVAYATLGRVSGFLLSLYVILKVLDTLVWMNRTAPATGFRPFHFYTWQPFGTWILFTEIVVCGLVPAFILLFRARSADPRWLLPSAVLACGGVVLNRFVMTIQTLSLPTMAFDPFRVYLPSWQEVAAAAGVLAYGVVVYSLSFRYLPLFPHERRTSGGVS
jgi:molybdopterin-containing oxidoreductase family membrane subunit